jgi:hypothetical protein
MQSYDENITLEKVGSWAPATNEDWFWGMTWNVAAAQWTFYAGKAGSALTSAAGSAGRSPMIVSDLRIGAQNFGYWGSNLEVTNVMLSSDEWSSADFAAQKLSATPVGPNVLGWWKLLNSSDLTDYQGSVGDLTSVGSPGNGSMSPSDIS